MLVIVTQGCQIQVELVRSPGTNSPVRSTSFRVSLVGSDGQLGLPSEYPTESEVALHLSPSMQLVPSTAK